MTGAAVLLCGHGSRDPEALAEFEAAAVALRRRLGGRTVETGYLEFARPTLAESLGTLAAGGARQILAIPAMLLASRHVRDDVPGALAGFAASHPTIDLRLGGAPGIDGNLLRAASDHITAAMPEGRAGALLVIVGRGTHNAEANAEVAEIACLLGGRLGFGAAEAAFVGIAGPRLDAVLDAVAARRFGRVVVLPYLLFAGVLVRRIRGQVAAAAERFPAIEFLAARHLGGHPGVVEAWLDRIAAADRECSTAS